MSVRFLLLALLMVYTGETGSALAQGADTVKTNFDQCTPADNPWDGVGNDGNLRVFGGGQPIVSDTGAIQNASFGPSVAVGDLNGDGLNDLVVADGQGFFWFYANSGTKTVPKFTHGEVMPIWIGVFPRSDNPVEWDQGGATNTCPHIQLVDLFGGKLDIVAGNYAGRLFIIRNQGSGTVPVFKMPEHSSEMEVRTRANGQLWTNFLAPFFYNWFGTGIKDLIIGDGSYSANSVFALQNIGSADQPQFSEKNTYKIVPGMGREHLTPQVVDWNGDGKPDIISGERSGYINVFLNQGGDPKNPTFGPGEHISLGGHDTFGTLTNVTVCDLNDNKLPNLIISNSEGQILYAKNKGTPGHPDFDAPVQVTGVNPLPQVLIPQGWSFGPPFGLPRELMVTTNAKVEPGFSPPAGTNFTTALRYYLVDTKPKYFTQDWFPPDNKHQISRAGYLNFKGSVNYRLSFWVKSSGITDLEYAFGGTQFEGGVTHVVQAKGDVVRSGETWTHYSNTVSITPFGPDKTVVIGQDFHFTFYGKGSLYITGFEFVPETGL